MSSQTQTQSRPFRFLDWPRQWPQRLLHLLARQTGFASAQVAQVRTTRPQRQLAMDALVMGMLSIVGAVFPICGIAFAVGGILLGLKVFTRLPGLRSMGLWALLLSGFGTFMILLCLSTSVAIYLENR